MRVALPFIACLYLSWPVCAGLIYTGLSYTGLIYTGLIYTGPVRADEVSFGLGQSRFNAETGADSAVFSALYRKDPFAEILSGSLAWQGSLDLHAKGDAFLGVGLGMRWMLNEAWFVEASVMPGLWHGAGARNDLGGTFQFRSTLGIGRWFDTGAGLSLSVTHESNAHLEAFNPGLETIFLRWHRAF